MNILEFENTQGITLRYSTANVIERGVSFLLDFIIIVISVLILEYSFTAFNKVNELLNYLIVLPFFIFYSLFFEIFNDGRSPGKMIMGLKVIRIDGRPVSGYDYLMRWLFRAVDIYFTLGTLAAVMVSATPRSQRIGDMLADTTVIRIKNARINLNRLLNLEKLAEYKPVYPQAINLNEEQILLIRESLQRSRRYNNQSHNEVLEEVAERVATLLNVNDKIEPNKFLGTVIKDYVSMTR